MTRKKNQLQLEHQAALAAMQQGDFRQAHQHCLAVLRMDNRHADAWFLCAVIAGHNDQLEKAEEIFHRALSLDQKNTEYLAELGKNLTAQQRPSDALRVAQKAMRLEPEGIATLNTLGTVFSFCGEHGPALICYERAAKILEKNPPSSGARTELAGNLYFNLGASLQFAGHFDAAEAAYEKALDFTPTMFRAHTSIAALRRQTPENNHLQRLEEQKTKVRSSRDQLHLGHAIAKEKEDLGLYQDALHALTWGKEAHAKEAGYQRKVTAELFSGLKELFSVQGLQTMRKRSPGCDSQEPIFIVGMPRTGTTLLEQILGNHPDVYAAGELPNFPQQMRRLTGARQTAADELELLQKASAVDSRELGESYIDSTRPRTGHTRHFTDKLPLNFKHLGLISLALPRAKLVCLRRDPMDTCLSNFRQMFALEFRQYHYSLDLLDCGDYYLQFDQLMQHWRNVLPGMVHEVWYEELVQEPEDTTRELLDFCGLPWDEQCLDFQNSGKAVATPSAVQVRQGIYTSSVKRWEKFGEAMQPLYALLQDAGLYDQGRS